MSIRTLTGIAGVVADSDLVALIEASHPPSVISEFGRIPEGEH
jgi:hypothetical protein